MKYNAKSIIEPNESTGRSPIGFFKNDDSYTIVTPYGLSLPHDIDLSNKEEHVLLKKYARCISKALNKDKVKQTLVDEDGANVCPLSAINVVIDYIQNGIYQEIEKEYTKQKNGNINFNKTIKNVSPYISGNEAIYLDFIVNHKKVSSQKLISIAQANVINHFMDNGGEIFFGQKIRLQCDQIPLNKNLIYRLQQEKNQSFNSRKIQLINWMIDYIEGSSSQKVKGAWNFIIIASTLWEEMIDGCYSNQIIRNKSLYGRRYIVRDNTKIIKRSNFTQHDTIYETNDALMIIDAKMYLYADDLASDSVLGKQFGYYDKARKKNPNKKIFNILIKPYVEGVDAHEGFISSIEDDIGYDDHEKVILVYAANFTKILDLYYAGKKVGDKLLEEAINYTSQEFN